MIPDAPGGLRQLRISDQIARHVTAHIQEGGLRPGDPLPSESELARRFGVSRPAVREAMNALAGRGLVAIASGRPPSVLSLQEDPFSALVGHGLATRQVTAVQALEVRRGLEEQAAALAAAQRTAADVAAFEALLARLPGVVGDVAGFAALDIAFHRQVAEASRNPLMAALMAGMVEVVLHSSRSGLRHARDAAEWQEILSLHQQIATAIVAGRAEAARAAMAAHFDSALRRLQRE
ncbi:hypothetical protein BKE38_28545 [Pseudoroseomonas deserti]|uniref:HTH gntR-type domain-containing protein n=1 Tax=Teichococcus deserti TaxID=1817963 RepID=A0A1V2GUF8_9PROT|nr:FCD domain-containing protein [Pseudoroseomonas deserti]ONG43980.1 hypothetical protein BKE38_28545 [Pseudoroseomonas deserti]